MPRAAVTVSGGGSVAPRAWDLAWRRVPRAGVGLSPSRGGVRSRGRSASAVSVEPLPSDPSRLFPWLLLEIGCSGVSQATGACRHVSASGSSSGGMARMLPEEAGGTSALLQFLPPWFPLPAGRADSLSAPPAPRFPLSRMPLDPPLPLGCYCRSSSINPRRLYSVMRIEALTLFPAFLLRALFSPLCFWPIF